MQNRTRKIVLATTAAAAVAAPLAVTAATTAPAEAFGRQHHIVFRAWGTPYHAKVETWGKYDITRNRALPFRASEWNDAWSQYMSVEVPGFRTVGCSITVDGRVRARDVSSVGIASCLAPSR